MGQHNTEEYGGGTAQTTGATLTPAAWFTPQKGKGYLVTAYVIGVDEGGVQAAGYILAGAYRVTDAGAIVIAGSVGVIHSGETNGAWAATLSIANAISGAAAGTGPYIRVDVTGEAAKVINWRANIEPIRVGFAGGKT